MIYTSNNLTHRKIFEARQILSSQEHKQLRINNLLLKQKDSGFTVLN